MSIYLSTSPPVLAFLQEAKERPEDDAPRLVLADWLEEHGDPDRAEFIRMGCCLAPGAAPHDPEAREQLMARSAQLLDRYGGAWLGSLWRWWLGSATWHRGLLAAKLPRRFDPSSNADVLPWIDTALFVLHGRGGVQRVVDYLNHSRINHAHFDLRPQMREDVFLDMLAQLPASACLRSLSIHWPLALLRRADEETDRPLAVAAVSDGFLATLLGDLPLGRHLTHLGSSHPFAAEQHQVIRDFGVEPVHAQDNLWMHRQPATIFQAQSAGPSSLRPLSSSS